MDNTLIATLITAGAGIVGILLKIAFDVRDVVGKRGAEEHEKGGYSLLQLSLETHDEVVRIKQQMSDLEKWREGYDSSPWNTGVGAREWLAAYESYKKTMTKRIEALEKKIHEHSA